MEKIRGRNLILIFLLVSLVNNYILSMLGELNVPTGQSLLARGLACTLCSIIGGLYWKENVLPRSLKTQVLRFFFAGFGLWAVVESYQFARASEIAIISRLDLPIIIIFGFFISLKTSKKQKLMAIFLMAGIIFSIWTFSDEHTTFHGLMLAALGTLTLSLSYLLLNHTAKTESSSIVSLTPALACVVFGAAVLITSKQALNPSPLIVLLTAMSGVSMYSAYRVVRHLYRRYTFLRAQIAYVLIPIISIPIDLIAFGKHFHTGEYFSFLLISIGVVATCLFGEKHYFRSGESKNEYYKATA